MKKIIIAVILLFWTLFLTWCFEKKEEQTNQNEPQNNTQQNENNQPQNTWDQNVWTWNENLTGENTQIWTWSQNPSQIKTGWESTLSGEEDKDVEEIVNALNQIIEEE